ncbi:MAG: TIGR03560 family F420-dependent LLM class oxidoreductase [Dehalococcoidia bacterium]|nr:TIGR03560 family F420-dependent LLM class oxidoreductase [Dehalococcoidia bacterium]
MKVGVHAGQQDIEMDELRRLWRFVDQNGFDFLSCWDHFYEAPPIDGTSPAFEAVATMAAMAVETENVTLGCHVFCMNYRNPALLAKALLTVDHLSHGRIEPGFGAGWHVAEHEAYGYTFPPVKERLDRLEEGLQIIRAMFSEERANFDGEYYRVQDAMLYPRPVREHTPLVVGGRGERRTLRIAARYADGWNVPYINVEEFDRLSGVLDMWCEKEDRDPVTIERSINLHMHMGANEGDAQRIAESRGSALSRGGRAPSQGAVSGTPQRAIETLKAYEEAGAARVSIAIRPPVEWDALQAFAEEVIPAVK